MTTPFRVASFNVENLNRAGVGFAGRENDAAFSADTLAQKCSWIGRIFDQGRIDLAGIQEVFSHEALAQAAGLSTYLTEGGRAPNVRSPETEGRANETVVEGITSADGPYNGLVTRLPVLACTTIHRFDLATPLLLPHNLRHHDSATTEIPYAHFERPILHARVALPDGNPANVLVAHLKSKSPAIRRGHEDPADPRAQAEGAMRSLVVRAVEAVALRQIIVRFLTAADADPLIVLGDMNDGIGTVATDIIAGGRPDETWPTDALERANACRLTSAHDLQAARSARDVAYTHGFGGRLDILDHIFLSRHFVREQGATRWTFRGTRIFNDHVGDRGLSFAPVRHRPVSTDPRPVSLISDHGIPVCEIAPA